MLVYVPKDNSTESVDVLYQMFQKRLRTDQEIWLVDISAWNSLDQARETFKDLPLDLDDDLFWYSFSQSDKNTVKAWEVYRMHKTRPLTVKFWSNWSIFPNSTEHKTNTDKWARRRDLQVCLPLENC